MTESVGSEAKLLAKHGSIYGLANILDRLVSFVMIPVYTRYLTPADYGILELIYMTTSIIAMVIGLRIEAAVSRFYFDYEDQKSRNKAISTGFLGYGGLAFGLSLALLPLSGFFAQSILDSQEHTNYFMVALLTLGFGMVLPISYAYFRVTQQSFKLLVFKISLTVVTLGLNIYFVVFAEMGVYGILLATLIAQGVFAVILMFYILARVGLRTDRTLLWEMVKFGLPLIPSNLAAYLVHASDRYFIKEYVAMSSAGLYSLGYKFGALVNQFVTSPFTQIWTPRRFERFQKEGSEAIYARIFTYFVTLSLMVGLGISVLSKEIIMVMATEPFWPAHQVVPIITLSYIVFSFHYHFNVGILMEKKTKFLAYVNVSNGALNLALNFILIPRYGIWGAAFATLACFLFKVALTYYFSNRFHKIVVEWKRVLILFATAFVMYFLITQIETGNLWLNVGVKAVAVLGYPLALYVSRFFTPEEIHKFRRMVKNRRFSFD